MVAQQPRLWPQPGVALALGALALLALAGALLLEAPLAPLDGRIVLLLLLAAAVVAAYQFPLQLRPKQKLELTTVAYYLLATLSPSPALGMAAAGAGLLVAELLVRARRGNLYSDVATAVSRYMLIVLAGSGVARLEWSAPEAGLVAAALVMLLLDFATLPILIIPASGETLVRVFGETIKRGLALEVAQYVLGLVGVFAALGGPWNLAVLLPLLALLQLIGARLLTRDIAAALAAPLATPMARPHLPAGDAAAAGQLAGQYAAPLYRFVYYQLGDAAQAADIVGLVLAQAVQSAATLRPAAELDLWLFRRARELSAAHAGTTGTLAQAPVASGFQGEVAAALQRLSSAERTVLLLRVVDNWPAAKIATLLGCSTAMVLALQYNALRAVSRALA